MSNRTIAACAQSSLFVAFAKNALTMILNQRKPIMPNLSLSPSALASSGTKLFGVILTLCLTLWAVGTVSAQSTTNYTFTTAATGSLGLDMNGNTLDMSTNTNSLLTASTDDTRSSLTNIGFDFFFMGTRNATFSCTDNGIVELGGNTVGTGTYLISANTTLKLLAPFADDMRVGTDGKVHYKLFGSYPNRVLVIEYSNIMIRYISTAAAGGGTWQVRLYETTGVVEYVYGGMTTNSATQNAVNVGFGTNTTTGTFVTVNSSHTANTSGTFATFTPTASSTVTHLHSTAEGSRRYYRFTPPIPTAPTSLSFTGVTISGMTLNWTDNATNERAYAVYNSTDNVNFSYFAAGAANAISSTATGLTPNTTYYWQVAAVSEGGLSSLLGGSQATAACPSISGTKTIPGDYATLTAALAEMSTCGITGATVLELQSGYSSASETYPLTIGNIPNNSSTNTITIRPATGVTKTITSANTTATIDLNGAKNVIIDGQPGGTGGTKGLTIANTSTTTGGTAIRFINDAASNTVRYATLQALYASTSSGVVNFSTTTGTTGNDGNTIDNCDIDGGAGSTASPTTVALNGIYAAGTSTKENSGNTISNNNIFNFFGAATASNGILISSNNTDWTINNNSFYQTATRTATTGNTQTGINISNSSGNNFQITNNKIGGDSANATATSQKWTVTGAVSSNLFNGILIAAGTTTASSVQGNTIRNISFQSATSAGNVFLGISVTAGNVNIGTTTGNTIGSTTVSATTAAAASIALLQSSSNGGIGIGIANSSSGTLDIRNNTIGGVYLAAATGPNTLGNTFYGIRLTAGATNTVYGNTIGSTTNLSSIYSAGSLNATGNANTLTGVSVTGGTTNIIGGASAGQPNTVQNLNYTGLSTSFTVLGMALSSGSNTVQGNTIARLTSGTANVGTGSSASVIGISYTASTASATVTQNTIHSLTNNAAAATWVTGLHYSGPTSGTNVVGRNLIHSLSAANTGATVNGIYVAGGTTTYQNNMIRLGLDATGASLTTALSLNGFFESSGTNNVYFNSIYVGGTGVDSTASDSYAFNGQQTLNTRIFQNNIFFNARSNALSGGKHYAVRYGGSSANPSGLTANYNIFYTTGTGGTFGRFNAADVANLVAWRTATGQDLNSGFGDPNFVNATGTITATPPLKVQGTTPAEGAGLAISGITDDYEGDTRSSNTPTDIGADAGNYTAQDIFPPAISYTLLSSSIVATSRTVSNFATIMDNVAVSSGASAPRLYYKKSTDNNAFVGNTSADNGWKYVLGTGPSPYSFTIDYTILNGGSVTAGNTIQYFVVAQDDANNFTALPTGAAASGNPPVQNINAYTGTANSYTIAAALSGTRTVCASGCDYATLTNASGAFAAINAGVLTANLTLSINGDLALEDGTNALNQWAEDGAGNYTLTIKPNAARKIYNPANISSTSGLLRFNGADRVTIDGSQTVNGTTKDLTIVTTHSTASSAGAAIFIDNSSVTFAVRNCILKSNSSSASSGALAIGATGVNTGITVAANSLRNADVAAEGVTGTVTGNPANGLYMSSASNTNITIGGATAADGNEVFNFTAMGLSVLNAGNGAVINNNSIYSTLTLATAQTGIFLGGGNGQTVSNNCIGGQAANCGGSAWANSGAVAFVGINLGLGTTTASSVQGNKVQNISLTSTGAATFTGLNISAGMVNAGTVTGNTIGHASTANSITVAGSSTTYGVSVASSSTYNLSNNTIANVTASGTGTGVQLIGIRATAGTLTINSNTISELRSASTKTFDIGNSSSDASTFAAVAGIISSSSTGSPTISGNTISGLRSTTTAVTNTGVVGIEGSGPSSASSILRNRLYDLTNTATGTSTTPGIAGIRTYSGLWTIANNQISLTNAANTNGVRIFGLHEGSGNQVNYNYNSVFIGGSQGSSTANSAGWDNYYNVSFPNLSDNLLYNSRTGSGTGAHFAISQTATPSTFTSNYNLLVAASATTIGFRASTALTFAGWKTAISGDANSTSDVVANVPSASLFTSTSAGNLNINTGVATYAQIALISNVGTNVSGITSDYGNTDTRNATAPDIGADEFNYTGTLPASVNGLVVNSGDTFTPAGGGTTVTGNATVNSGGTLGCGTLSGTGNFTLSSSGTINICDAAGITGSGATGQIQMTGTRSFGTGANYTYMGSAAQVTGDGLPATVNNLTITNSNGVTLTGDVTVAGTLALTNGILNARTNSRTVYVSNSATGAVSAPVRGNSPTAGSSSYVLGNLKRALANGNTYSFDVGDGGYTPVELSSVSGSGDFTVSATDAAMPAVFDANRVLSRYWSLTKGTGVNSAVLKFTYLAADVPTPANENTYLIFRDNTGNPNVGFFNVASTIDTVNHTATTTAAQSTFSNWSVGEPDAPTLVKFKDYNGYHFNEGNLLRWRTGYETRNLGFVVYRQDGQQRTRITPNVVAGSALTFGSKVTLTAGQSYAWWDKQGAANSTYWVEDIDLNGTRTMHGPIALQQGDKALAQLGNSPTLDDLRPASDGTGRIEEQLLPKALRNSTARPTPGSDAWTRQLQLANSAALKLQVRQNGWYRVSGSQLAAAGLPANAEARLLQLYLNGVQVPLGVRTANGTDSGPLGATGVIEFYGLAQDAVETESNAYWLIAGAEPGLRFGAPVSVAPRGGTDGENGASGTVAPNGGGKEGNGGATTNAPTPDVTNRQSFAYTVERKDRSYYLGNIHNGAAGNFLGTIITGTASSQTVRVNQLDPSATDMATVTVAIQGFTERPHRIQVALNGNNLGIVTLTSQEHKIARFNVVPSALQEGDNTITMRALEGDEDVSATDYVRITYARRFTADQNRLLFTTGNRQSVSVNGFTSANVRVFDVTDTGRYFAVAAKTVSEAGGYTATVSGNLNSRTLLAIADETALTPASITANTPSSWTNSAREADFVILTPEAFRSAVEPLANLRRGQGLRTEVVSVEDIYDEWNAGAKSGDALRSFLEWTRTNWQTAPQYVLLVGDASFDPRNYLGYGATDLTPTLYVDTPSFETASDDALVDFNGDGVPEMSIGRLPGRTLAQVTQLITRTVNYQANPNGGAAFIADRPEGYDFVAVNQDARNLLPEGMSATMINRAGQADATVRTQIVNAINAGPSVVQYAGHGSIEVWTEGNLLDDASIAALTNNNRLSVFVMMTCLNGYFHDVYSESLAERLMRAPNGGAVAVWASSTLTDTTNQAPMDKELFRLLYANGNAPRLGDAMRQAKAATTNGEVRRTWILFGDPTLRIR